jgi:tetratricopeptide (TPR) repeat protein
LEDNEIRPRPEVARLQKLELEAQKLREYLEAKKEPDPDLQTRLQHLEQDANTLREQLAAAPVPEPTPEVVTPPTRAELDKAEKLIQQARLAKSRGKAAQMAAYLKQAEEAAPNAPMVLEFIGDQYLEQKRTGDARAAYKKAHDLDPKNVGVERKWAMTIVSSAPMGDPMMLAEYESMASSKIAAVLSGIVPGLGQIVLGEFAKGAFIVVVWLGMLLWMLPYHPVQMIASVISGKDSKAPFQPIILVPAFIAFVLWVSAIFDAKMTSGLGRKPIARPAPPDSRPFE